MSRLPGGRRRVRRRVRRGADLPIDTERGAATVMVVGLLAVLMVVGCVLAEIAGVVRADRQAQAAADLAALAAAGADCGAATSIALANGARLTSCRHIGADALVKVEVTPSRWLGPMVTLDAEARAGPGAAGLGALQSSVP